MASSRKTRRGLNTLLPSTPAPAPAPAVHSNRLVARSSRLISAHVDSEALAPRLTHRASHRPDARPHGKEEQAQGEYLGRAREHDRPPMPTGDAHRSRKLSDRPHGRADRKEPVRRFGELWLIAHIA